MIFGPDTASTTRIDAENPVALAAAVSQLVFPSRSAARRPNVAILAPLEDGASALAATSLIHAPHHGPVLFTYRTHLPPETEAELRRLQPTGVSLRGGDLPAQVLVAGNPETSLIDHLRRLGFRGAVLQGEHPAEVAAQAARYRGLINQQPWGLPRDYFVGETAHLRELLPLATLMAHSGVPLLYVENGQIPPATRALLEAARSSGSPVNLHLAGRAGRFPEGLVKELGDLAGGVVLRWNGGNADAVAVNLAQHKDPNTRVGWGKKEPAGHAFTFVTGTQWPPAVAAALLGHMGKHTPLLPLPLGDGVPELIAAYLRSINPHREPHEPPYPHGFLVGGRLSAAQQEQLDGLLTSGLGVPMAKDPVEPAEEYRQGPGH